MEKFVGGVIADTEVAMNAPVNPVPIGGMLSIHCRVLNMNEETQTVQISREMADGAKYAALTMGDKIYTDDDDERIFLAVRRLSDSSKVYFLSIIDVKRSDEGVYKCKLLQKNPMAELVIKPVSVTVNHVPDEAPECSAMQRTSYTAGDTLNLNCSSEEGSPMVTLAWYRSTQAAKVLASKTHHLKKDGTVISELSKTLYESDNQAMFICKLTSDAFPDVEKTCHIGPISVLPNPLFTDKGPAELEDENSAFDSSDELEYPNNVRDKNNGRGGGEDSVDFPTLADPNNTCSEYCSTLTAPVLYWIIATIAISILAIIFLMIGIVISMKLCNATSDEQARRQSAAVKTAHLLQRGFAPLPPGVPGEDTYAELEGKPGDENRVYMMLDRRSPYVPEMQPLNPNLEREGNYTRTPTAIKEITLIPSQCV